MDADQYSNALAGHDDDEEDDGSGFVRGIGANPHHMHAQTGAQAFAAHPDYGRQELSIDPNLSSHPPPDHHQQHQSHAQQHTDVPHQHQHVGSHYGPQHMSRQMYGTQYALEAPTEQPSEPSPAHFTSASPAPNLSKPSGSYTPTDRSLPDKRVTDETLDDAYVAFILYCNPAVPLDTDTTELRKVFRQPPKSDGKTFNVYRLLQLIEKFERKDIKTWTKLAIELGVEKTPDSSSQKVQQYAVRLKRWMHAMHVDAFFEYILDKPHSYYQKIPPIDQDPTNPPGPDRIRDGVPVEEDLALRALHPETRPKRGRRKGDDRDDNSEKDAPAAKRQHMETATPTGAEDIGHHFVYPPSSAGADGMSLFDEAVTPDQWTAATQSVLSGGAATPTGGQQFRWRAYPKIDSATTPHGPHPPPNLITTHDHDTHNTNDEGMTPVSATPTSAKPPRRRRHGPAVSSAWPSSGNPLTGKLRGRPPSNRSIRDGPFSTFPASPVGKAGPTIDISPVAATPTGTPIMSHPTHQFPGYRPQNLHLTVPQQGGRQITMSSPAVERHPNGIEWLQPPPPPPPQPRQQDAGKTASGVPLIQKPVPKQPSVDDLQRRFGLEVMRMMANHGTFPDLNDATLIAEKIFAGFRHSYGDSCAEKVLTLAGSGSGETGYKGLQVHRLQSELEELGIHDPEDEQSGGLRDDSGERRYEVRWETMFGDLKGEFVQIVALPPNRDNQGFELSEFDRDVPGETIDDLQKKVKDLENKLKNKDKDLMKMRENVFKAVVS